MSADGVHCGKYMYGNQGSATAKPLRNKKKKREARRLNSLCGNYVLSANSATIERLLTLRGKICARGRIMSRIFAVFGVFLTRKSS